MPSTYIQAEGANNQGVWKGSELTVNHNDCIFKISATDILRT